MGAKILLYHAGEEKQKKIKSAVALMGISVELLDESNLGQQLGKLAGSEEYQTAEDQPWEADLPQEEVLIMCGFTKVQFDLLMNMFRHGKLPKIALKAMLTETNQNWPLGKLIGELKAEHVYLHQKKKTVPRGIHHE